MAQRTNKKKKRRFKADSDKESSKNKAIITAPPKKKRKISQQSQIPIQKGCFVQKVSTINDDDVIYQCAHLPNCKVVNILSSKPKITKASIQNLIPQTICYYHKDCTKHAPLNCDRIYLERPQRIISIMKLLKKCQILQKTVVIRPKCAKPKQLLSIHTAQHLLLIAQTHQISKDYNSKSEQEEDTQPTGWFGGDTFYNEHSYKAALLASGAAINLVKNIAINRCVNGLAIVRPPGHHAEYDFPCGFCLFNNVSVAVEVARERNLCKRVLIVDWDIHHGNGTQNAFINDESVLYFSIHRHDNGFFYPFTGKIKEHGNGYNVNVPLNAISDARYGDAAYYDIWKCILLPIAESFDPEVIVISAGFDAGIDDPINGDTFAIPPPCYGLLTRMLMNVCPKVAVVLEGGYNLKTISESICYVAWALLSGPIKMKNIYDNERISKMKAADLKKYIDSRITSRDYAVEFDQYVIEQCKEKGLNSYFNWHCNDEYEKEQIADETKFERRNIMKKVLAQHCQFWSVLKPFHAYFMKNY